MNYSIIGIVEGEIKLGEPAEETRLISSHHWLTWPTKAHAPVAVGEPLDWIHSGGLLVRSSSRPLVAQTSGTMKAPCGPSVPDQRHEEGTWTSCASSCRD